MKAAEQLAPQVGISEACNALGISRATFYRQQQPTPREVNPRPRSARSLSEAEQQAVLEVLHSERFVDQSPAEIYATLLDESIYLCSLRTMYRLLAKHEEVRERRNQRQQPIYQKPQLLATGPNQLWSWDITKLNGPGKYSYFHLYVILDVFSRYAAGWMVAHRESKVLAERLIRQTCQKQQIQPNQLTLHADQGSSMRSKNVAFLLSDLGIIKSHSRPHVSNDNPFSEAQFKTLKYQPQFPQRFGSLEDSRTFCRSFFDWYNNDHHHSGIGWLTPTMLHYGQAEQVMRERQQVLLSAYLAHPERFVRGMPVPPRVPTEVWINPPLSTERSTQKDLH
jgi:putative transposase